MQTAEGEPGSTDSRLMLELEVLEKGLFLFHDGQFWYLKILLVPPRYASPKWVLFII